MVPYFFYKPKNGRLLAIRDKKCSILRRFPKDSGTLVSSSFNDVYENVLLVKPKSSPITPARKFLCGCNCRRVIDVAER
jgi:hypothetical protein